MQGIEKKVRMDLHLQRFQLRLHQLGAKLRGLQLVLAITVVIVERVAHQQDEPVNQRPVIEVVIEKIEHPERCDRRCTTHRRHEGYEMKRDQSAGKHDTEKQMKQRAAYPVASFDAKTAREPENQRRGERPDIAGRRLHQKSLQVGDPLALRVITDIDLGGEEERDERPDTPDQPVTYPASGEYGLVFTVRNRIFH